MLPSWKFAGAIAGFTLSMTVLSQAHALTLCGIADGSAGDLDTVKNGSVTASCGTATGMFAGTLKEFKFDDFDGMTLRGTITGSGSFSFSNAYDIGPWKGKGSEWSELFLRFKDPKAPHGTTSLTAYANTFSANSAIAQVTPTTPPQFYDPKLFFDSAYKFGSFDGQGILLGTLTWAVGTNVATLDPGDIGIRVPEPGTWALMVLGFGGVGVALRNRRTAVAAA